MTNLCENKTNLLYKKTPQKRHLVAIKFFLVLNDLKV